MEHLYRHYAANGDLLYVGITCQPGNRTRDHIAESAWWPLVVRIDIEHFPDRASVLEAERAAIATERPMYNKLRPTERVQSPDEAVDHMRLAYKPVEAAKALGVSRSRVFEYLRTGDLRSVLRGGVRLIPRSALLEFLEYGPET